MVPCKTKHGNCEEFDVKIGVHQGSVLSLLLFVIVLESLTKRKKEGLWELLYSYDLMLMTDSMDLLHETIMIWRDWLECDGLKVNLNKSKRMMSDGSHVFCRKMWQVALFCLWRGVCRNSIQSTKCLSSVQKRCSGVKNL